MRIVGRQRRGYFCVLWGNYVVKKECIIVGIFLLSVVPVSVYGSGVGSAQVRSAELSPIGWQAAIRVTEHIEQKSDASCVGMYEGNSPSFLTTREGTISAGVWYAESAGRLMVELLAKKSAVLFSSWRDFVLEVGEFYTDINCNLLRRSCEIAATTIAYKNKHAWIAHIGSSRCLAVGDEECVQLTQMETQFLGGTGARRCSNLELLMYDIREEDRCLLLVSSDVSACMANAEIAASARAAIRLSTEKHYSETATATAIAQTIERAAREKKPAANLAVVALYFGNLSSATKSAFRPYVRPVA